MCLDCVENGCFLFQRSTLPKISRKFTYIFTARSTLCVARYCYRQSFVRLLACPWRWGIVAIIMSWVSSKVGAVFSRKLAISLKRGKIGPRLLLMTNIASFAYALSIGVKINDLGWPWTAVTHSVSQHMRFSEPTTKIWMNIDDSVIHLFVPSLFSFSFLYLSFLNNSGVFHHLTVVTRSTKLRPRHAFISLFGVNLCILVYQNLPESDSGCFCGNRLVYHKATGNSRSESQKSPPLSVKIPENSRYENTAYASRV